MKIKGVKFTPIWSCNCILNIYSEMLIKNNLYQEYKIPQPYLYLFIILDIVTLWVCITISQDSSVGRADD